MSPLLQWVPLLLSVGKVRAVISLADALLTNDTGRVFEGLVLKETAPSSDEAAPDATGAGEVSFESFADPFAAQGGNAFAAAPDPAADADRSSGHRRWVCDGQFGELTYWNHDKPTTEADSVPKALRWHALAGALHDSVESSDIELERGMV